MSGPLDPRVVDATRGMLALRRRRVEEGGARLGWKAAFGSPSGLAALGIDRPLVGFLTRDRLLDDGAVVPVDGWTRPVLEAEVAVHIGHDLPPSPDASAVQAAIIGLSAAIEVADVDRPPTDVGEILAGNIFHRYVVIGAVHARRHLAGVTARVSRDGTEVARADEPEALTGRLLDVVTSMADTLGQVGERLRAGDVVITGSVVPPVDVAPGERLTVSFTGLGDLEVGFGWGGSLRP